MSKQRSQAAVFVAAISNGAIKEAESLLSAGYDINQKVDGMTALHFVVTSRSSMAGFKWLLQKGASLDERDQNELTPLMLACGRAGSAAKKMAVALIDAGCDVNARRSSDGMSALEFAAASSDPEVIRALVARGAELDGKREGNLFPALMAVRGGKLANVQTLVELGCDLGRTTQLPWAKGLTCLGVARLEGHNAIVKYLERVSAS